MTPGDQVCEVAVFAPAPSTYHYRVGRGLAPVEVGQRVLVPFGARKVAGVVVRASVDVATQRELRDVAELLEEAPVPADVVGLCMWVADYYLAPPGEALRGALPAGSQLRVEDVLTLTAQGQAAAQAESGGALPRGPRDALAAILAAGQLRTTQLGKRLRAFVPELIRAGLVVAGEERHTRTSARMEMRARLRAGLDLEACRTQLARAPARWAVVETLATAGTEGVVARNVAGAALRSLIAAGIAERFSAPLPLTGPSSAASASALAGAVAPPVLTTEQQHAYGAIASRLGGFATVLIHGVTGSGKTEVYLHAIADVLAAGQSAIVLVPEISLTPQLLGRFAARFGDQVAVLHSGLSERERFGEWQRLRSGSARIALGARSAIFAPVANLGIIVVDEEHDGSFKQDEGVRYNARDVAQVRAQRAGAVCVLGSATPSLESYAAAINRRVHLVRMTQRPGARPMPTVEIVDLRTHRPDSESMLSAPLAQAIADTLAAGDQAIIFLNRRGFATFVLCVACGHSFRCRNCDVSLTYHQHQDRLLCHYCGHAERVPAQCPSCAGPIARKGLGTERVAESLAARFPGARVARLDRDVATGAKIEAVLARVARREVDLLVGTQMVTKGHDFPGVTLVGVLCADVGLSLPDFRASERTFQLLAQVAGRAGRGERGGRVVIQTFRPNEPAIVCAAAHDYESFYASEVAARADLMYPPHGRLVALRIDGPAPDAVAETSRRLGTLAAQVAVGVEVLGPVAAPLSRLRGRSRWQLWLRSADRARLHRAVRDLRAFEPATGVRVTVDVDPISTL